MTNPCKFPPKPQLPPSKFYGEEVERLDSLMRRWRLEYRIMIVALLLPITMFLLSLCFEFLGVAISSPQRDYWVVAYYLVLLGPGLVLMIIIPCFPEFLMPFVAIMLLAVEWIYIWKFGKRRIEEHLQAPLPYVTTAMIIVSLVIGLMTGGGVSGMIEMINIFLLRDL